MFDHNRVRNARIRKGMSRHEAAAAAGMRHTVIARIEAGQRTEPQMDTLRKLAEVYGLNVVDFYAEVTVEAPRALVEGAA